MKLTATITVLLVLSVLAGDVVAGDKPPAGTMAEGVEAFDGGDYKRAVAIWQGLASTGDVHAMVALGSINRTGEGVPKNLEAARNWYRLAAIGGSGHGMQAFGHMLLQGDGGPRDSRAAYCWLKRAGQKGKAFARELTQRVQRDLPKIPQAGECRDLRARTGAQTTTR